MLQSLFQMFWVQCGRDNGTLWMPIISLDCTEYGVKACTGPTWTKLVARWPRWNQVGPKKATLDQLGQVGRQFAVFRLLAKGPLNQLGPSWSWKGEVSGILLRKGDGFVASSEGFLEAVCSF